MTDRERAGLRGPVRRCASELVYVYPEGDRVMHTSLEFSAEGNLLEQRHRNPDGSEWSIVCLYDDRGCPLRKEQRGTGPVKVFSYRYDARGRLERVVTWSEGSAERVCESYQYDAAGRKAATVYPDPELRARGTAGVDIEAAFEISIEASSILTLFDERDRPVKRVFYDPNGTAERRVLLQYDAAGRLIEEGESEASGRIREDYRNLYRYDAEGRLIEKTMHLSAFGTHRKTFVYNEQGDVLEERRQQTAGILEQGDHEWATRYRRQYDNRGNWIEQVAEGVVAGGEPRVSTIERRRLEYYE